MRQSLGAYGLGKAEGAARAAPGLCVPGGRVAGQGRSWVETAGPGIARSLLVLLPGATHLLRGRTAVGLFFISWIAFCGALSWAIVETIDRLALTLDLLGFSVTAALWMLALAYFTAATLHLVSMLTAERLDRRRGRPGQRTLTSIAASLLIPGWGQLLNGDRTRGAVFLAGVWLVVGVRLAVSPAATELLNLYLPAVSPLEQYARDPVVLWTVVWTLPAVIWSLAVYDAASRTLSLRSTRRSPRT